MIRGIFCHDLPIYIDKNGKYGCTTLTNDVFLRYFDVVDELVVATRLYHLNCTLEEAHQEQITLPNMKFLDIPNLNRPSYYFTRLPKAKRMIEDEFKKCDLIFIRGGTIADIGVSLAKKYKKAYLCECGGSAWDGLWYYSLLGKLMAPWSELHCKRLIREAPFVLYVTEKWLQKKYPTNGINESVSDVLITSVSDEVLKNRIKKIRNKNVKEPWVIGTAAALSTRLKGQQYVIEAIARLRDEIDIRYELAGTGDPTYLMEVAEKFGVKDNVIIKGELTHQEVLEWEDSLDVYIQPSMSEGLPRALVEAMSRGCPCIGSAVGGIPELLEENAVFARGNVTELSSLLRKFFFESNLETHSVFNHNRAKSFQVDKLQEKRKLFFQQYKSFVMKETKHE